MVGFEVIVTLPSPKFQVLFVIGSNELDVSVNVTRRGISPVIGFALKFAIISEHPPLSGVGIVVGNVVTMVVGMDVGSVGGMVGGAPNTSAGTK